MKTIIIAAIARNGTIGRTSKPCDGAGCVGTCTGRTPANDIPWSYPETDAHFDAATMGHAVIMGRRAWESLPTQHRPLKGRTNIVVSSKLFGDDWISLTASRFDVDVLDELRADLARRNVDKLFVIGGAQLYAAAIPLADELDLTLIDRDYEGDVKFPGGCCFLFGAATCEAFGWRTFECIERRKGDHPDLTFTRWVRR